MPIYQFKCPVCDHEEERLQAHDAPAPDCPACVDESQPALKMEKQLSSPGFRLKGDGAYGRGRV